MATKARTQDRAQILDQIDAAHRKQRLSFRLLFIATWVVIVGAFVYALWVTDNIDTSWWTQWGPYILGGTWITLVVCLSSIIFASILAVLGALSRLSSNPIPNGVASLYVSLFRGTPLLVQIFFIYFALPQVGVTIPSIPAGILALSLNYGAYMTEIFRAGIQAVPPGQREAAEALGMPERLVFRRIVLPQAFRIVIPAVGNDFIAMIKDSRSCLHHRRAGAAVACPHGRHAGLQDPAGIADRRSHVLGPDDHLQLLPGSPRAPDGAWRPMTDSPLPDLGPRSATATSGYEVDSKLPSHIGEPIVKVEGIHKYFGDNHVLRGVDLEVRQREAVMVIGRSGSGKTTLLRCINFLEEPTIGSIEVDGVRVEADPLRARDRQHREQIRQIRLRAGMLFQEFNLFPHLSVLGNCIEAPTRVLGHSQDHAVTRAEYYLEVVGLAEKRDEYPSRLSGGQKQRVAIARALCMEPKVLLFDEPTSALDPELIGEVLGVMEDLAHSGTTMIVVTHEMHFAQEAADRVVFMEDGAVIEQGPPEQVLNDPRHEATTHFLRRFLDR